MRILHASKSDVGMKRDNNEDNLMVLPEENCFAVFDGMGGHAAGEVASAIATNEVKEFFLLTGRDGLAPGAGLLLDPCNSVHTFFMRFSIDVAFLDAQGLVVALSPRLSPWRATRVHLRARTTLELAAGALEACGVRIGDRLVPASPGVG